MTIEINGTTGISGVDGSAGTPALQGSDTNTGISFGTDEVSINTGGTERVKVDSSGNVGIGTSSIDGSLHVKGAGTHGSFVLEAGGTLGSDNQIYIQGHNNAGVSLGEIHVEETATNQGALVLKTNGGSVSERMRIDQRGTHSMYSNYDTLYLNNANAAGTTYWHIYATRSSTGNPLSGTQSFGVYTNGNVVNTNNSYGPLSDIKLKENIVDANSQWDDLKALRVVNFNFKQETGYETHTQIGFIAQEVEQISPGLVYETPDRDEEGNDLGTVTKVLQTSVLYTKAVKALQEAMERIETLEAEVAALKAQ